MAKKIAINPFPGGIVFRSLWKILRFLLLIKDRLRAEIKYPPPSENLSQEICVTVLEKQSSYEMKEVFQELVGFPGVDIYIHGSWADETRTPFSDLDDLIVLDTQKIIALGLKENLINTLNKVDMKFCRIDPLQHHGHWIIDKDMLQDYDESYIPLTVLEEAICIQGSKYIEANINLTTSHLGLKNNINITIENIRKFHEKYYKDSINLYEMKRYVGSILLLPAYVFQTQGMRVSKKYAIEHSHEIFSKQAVESIISCSSIRLEWGKVTAMRSFNILSIASCYFSNPHFFRQFSKRLSPKFPKSEFARISSDGIAALTSESKQLAGLDNEHQDK